MPTSRKPRKKYHKRAVRYPGWTQEAVADAVARVDAAEMAAYISLQIGTATRDHMSAIRDVANLATALWGLRQEALVEYGDGSELVAAAVRALVSLVERCRRLRGPGCDQFAGTADELRAIQSGVAWAADIIRDRLAHEYRFTQKVLLNLIAMLGGPKAPAIQELTPAGLQRLATRTPRIIIKEGKLYAQ